MAKDQARSELPVRITTAAASRDDDIRMRQRRYIISMGIRTVCFVAAVIVGHGLIMWLLIVAALLLPYVAVVMANAASNKTDDFALRDVGRPELPAAQRPQL
jgi:Flp pilus assembly protein TadB